MRQHIPNRVLRFANGFRVLVEITVAFEFNETQHNKRDKNKYTLFDPNAWLLMCFFSIFFFWKGKMKKKMCSQNFICIFRQFREYD